ncbi:hypothetical protein PR202_ga27805 [Eleusine coracana subsp. coracana]|uniref:VIN3-like C-terminal domain-containing protein n=1 Tax=Eleusine coracana subsp. coracana TaxID=191504 RepID=A0AAV5DHX2_ELECO|nr:hypothetical protein PR202_ga27805 [Eleusine coracana subsp. coracana]
MTNATPPEEIMNIEAVNGEHPASVKHIGMWICKNLACKAVLRPEDSFCNKCSCYICHRFDVKKDESLCYLKRQLVIAKDARRLNSLCDHIFLVCRLLEGTSRFKELLEIVEDAKVKLESEVGPLDGMSAKMAQGIVRRSSTGIDVQKLCTTAIQKADEWLTSPDPHLQDSLPTACIFNFTDATSSSITIILKETLPSDTVKGYKLCRNATEAQMTVSSKQELLSYRKLGVNASSTRQLSEDYEDVIKLLRQLECHGHIDSDFRKKFMTWYSLRSTDQEGRAVSTLIETLGEDPNGLAEQLVDAFGEIIALKKPRT